MNTACSYRLCPHPAVAEVSFKGGAFVPACESHVKAYRAAAQSSGLSLREAALGESKFAQSPTEITDLRDRVAALEAFVFQQTKPPAAKEEKHSKEHSKG